MAKKNEIKFLSLTYQVNDNIHKAEIPSDDTLNDIQLGASCKCGLERCIESIKYRCMKDPNGKCIWWKTTETC